MRLNLRNKWWAYTLIIAAVLLGVLIRLYDLDDLPLDFHPTRQLHSYIVARGMYYEKSESLPIDERQIAIEQWKAEDIIEPPITERLVAFFYRISGKESIQIARITTISFWLIGGIGLFLLIVDMFGFQAAVIGIIYFLIIPYGVKASRAFQPEPLLIASITWAWWAMYKWINNPTLKMALVTGILAGLSVLIKSPAIFFVYPPLIILTITHFGIKKTITNLKFWFILILSIIPFSIYHIYGIFIDGFLKSQFSLRFFPALWGDTFFYRRWKDLIDSTLILELVLLSISGVILVQDKKKRIMLVSILFGYLLYGMVFSYHIHTHDYYQLPMLPVIAMGLSAFFGLLMEIRVKRKLLTTLILFGLVLIWMVSNLTDTFLNFRSANYRQEKEFWSSIGERIKGKTVISMTQDYGYRLAYWGWASSEHWFSSYDFEYRALAGTEMNQKELFLEAIEGKDLFVVTVFSELEKQPFVKDTLYKEYAIFDQSDSYIIFDLNQPIKVK